MDSFCKNSSQGGSDRAVFSSADLRSNAESFIVNKNVAVPSPSNVLCLSHEQALKLVHELQVHQIELEIQNEELKRTQEELELSKSQYFELYDLAPIGYCTVNDALFIEDINFVASTLLGVLRGKGKKGSFSRFILKEDQDIFYSMRKRALEEDNAQSCQVRMVKKNSPAFFWANLRAVAVHQVPKVSLRITIEDISENKKMEQDLKLAEELLDAQKSELLIREQAARKAAERVNNIKDQFLATLSHELRTPLTAILAWAQLLKTGRLDAEKTKRGLSVLEQSAKTQGQLIDDLLDISRIQAGKLILQVQNIDPGKIIEAAIESTRNLAAQKSISIEVFSGPLICPVEADAMRLQQILWNLITNAIKFSSPGGKVEISLDAVVEAGHDWVRIQVRDEGKGINADFLPIIFERFTQVDSSSTRAYGGLGLGLAIVHDLVKLHFGKVRAESAGPGKGATFTVCLPLRSEDLTHKNHRVATERAAVGPETAVPKSLAGLKILLVDDEDNAREVLTVTLESLGAKVCAAGSAQMAMETLRQCVPDILISDLAMPLEDGYALIDRVRHLSSPLSRLPAIALSAYAGAEDIKRVMLAGFQGHLAKPVESEVLAQAVLKMIPLAAR